MRENTVKVRWIDYVPLDERHGKLWHLGPLWFIGLTGPVAKAIGDADLSTFIGLPVSGIL
jgi:NCS1 family nucleobase:cation symporter-1